MIDEKRLAEMEAEAVGSCCAAKEEVVICALIAEVRRLREVLDKAKRLLSVCTFDDVQDLADCDEVENS